MATYRARICPSCRYFVGFSVSKSPATDKEVGVTSFCLNCSYRLPIQTILHGIRRAASKLRRGRLKLASNPVNGSAGSAAPANGTAPTDNGIIPPENYSRHLRLIGQQLQQKGIGNFNLQCTEKGYAVWTRDDTLTWPNRSFFKFGSGRLEKWRGIRNGAENGYTTAAPYAQSRFEFSLEDLERMEWRAKTHRDPMGGFANGHSLSQLLRTIGSLAYQRNHRLLAVAWRDLSICVVIETAPGKREIEVLRADNLYDVWVRMYLRRENRALSDVPH
jgi:hypothetical protein